MGPIPLPLAVDAATIVALIEHAPVASIAILVGATGICIAYYLAFVCRDTVPYRWTFGFFSFGSLVILANTQPFAPTDFLANIATGLRVLSLLIIGVAKLYIGYRVVVHYGVETPGEAVAETVRELRS